MFDIGLKMQNNRTAMTPKEIVEHLNRYIIGQNEAKKAVAIALRNRWRRQQIVGPLKEEILPKNILMIGPTGCGKTEIARRLAKLTEAPFLKVEATKFTEIGYVGRDVEQMVRDLVEISINSTKEKYKHDLMAQAKEQAYKKVLDILVGSNSSEDTRNKFKTMLEEGLMDDKEIEIEVAESQTSMSMPTIDLPGVPGGQMGMFSLGDVFGKFLGSKTKKLTTTVKEALAILTEEEADNLVDKEKMIKQALDNAAENGIIFIDEIDKICAKSEQRSADVSREGVQRDLLPLIEGTNVSTKYGSIKTDHILFITSGAFHVSKPSDLLPELQGRLPIRVELQPLTHEDFVRILKETESSILTQSIELMKTEEVELSFSEEAINQIALIATEINTNLENIGARRLHTVIEKLLEDISFEAPSLKGQKIIIDLNLVNDKLSLLAKNKDLSKFIL